MESKRKTRKVRKAVSAQANAKPHSNNPEVLIRYNGSLVEELFKSEYWTEIVFPLLLEMKAGVSGRFSNGRFHKGEFTRDMGKLPWLAGYQCALEEFHNNLHDFIVAKETLKKKKIAENLDNKAELYNPFMEDLNEEEN